MQDRPAPSVVPFRPAPVAAGVVETLEDALARARRGEFVSVVVCASTPAGGCVRVWHTEGQQLALLAGLRLMEGRLCEHIMNHSTPADDG